jgi:hypothetical protein
MEVTANEVAEWTDSEDRRVLREYETMPAMLDDIWRASEQGWLPISMTESKRRDRRRRWPWRLIAKRVIYLVSYRHPSH